MTDGWINLTHMDRWMDRQMDI